MGNAFSTGDTSETAFYDGLPRVESSKHETSKDRRDRTLKHLLRANHHNYAVLYNNRKFHNHAPHVLGSAYFFGATSEQLTAFYDDEAKVLAEWEDAPGEISRHDWRDYLGKREYQRAFLDFFEDELVRLGYDWRKVVLKYMLEGPNPLITGAIGGLGHPLIHLGYAFELDSREVGMEALVLAASNYNFLHKYIDEEIERAETPTEEAVRNSPRPIDILSRIREDVRFDGLFDSAGADNIPRLFEEKESVVLEYFRSYKFTDVAEAHKELNRLSTLILDATHNPGTPEYDFFFCHLLTTSYAVRTVLPELPVEFAVPLVKAHWLFIITVYCIQLRPEIKPGLIEEVEIGERNWDMIKKNSLVHLVGEETVADTHYLKALRTMEQSAKLWPNEAEFYQKAAVKLGWEFGGWTGFGTTGRE